MNGFALRQLAFKDYLTLGNAVSGFSSIISSLPFYFYSPAAAVFFIFLAAFFDFIDGKVARKQNKDNEFGKQLDSLCDAVSFGVAPAVFVLSSQFSVIGFLAAVAFLCAGIVRLALYNVQKEKGVYYGLPIPFAAMLVALINYFLPLASAAVLFIAAILMLSRFKLPKP